MSAAISILAAVVGVIMLGWILISAVRTVVIPRPERVWLTRITFELARRSVQLAGGRIADPRRRDQLLGMFGPAALLILPVLWSIGSMIGYALIFWGLDYGSAVESLELSGSSLTTLGLVTADTATIRLIAISEGLLGLGIVALMISFIPSLYGTFSRREIAVGRFTVRAGEPPSPAEFIIRLDAIGRLDHVGERWEEWEEWFVELGETHTSFPALIYFRSVRPSRSWLTAAEAALDTAAIVVATGLAPSDGQADTMIRSGYLSLRMIADFFDIDGEVADGQGEDSSGVELSVSRRQFEALLDDLATAGCAVPDQRDDAWKAFHGWRINYDQAVVGLAGLVGDVGSHWDTRPR
ncbi:MAG: hypothetical protein ACR2QK_19345 [Acidimicrobiales bacterium]